MPVQCPYVVGRWVRGDEHYDRQRLIEYLLTAHDTAIWVVGTRRMGKTSLLRQIELAATYPGSRYVPLFWDLQGVTTPQALSADLWEELDFVADRFADLDFDLQELQQADAVVILRRLSRALIRQGRQLLLLVDEAEALVALGQSNPAWLARLRRALQEGYLRAVVASTRLLSQLTDESMAWMTSPFLFGFHMVTLWPLRREGAIGLIRQLQNTQQVRVEEALVEEILRHTNQHPYLIQYLCERLFVEDEMGRYLRPLHEDDLAINHLLDGCFGLDYQWLEPVEQRILLTVVAAQVATEAQILAVLGAGYQARLPALLKSLKELGHLRPAEEGWRVGSEFLRRWLLQHYETLTERLADALPRVVTHQATPDEARLGSYDAGAVKRLDEENIEAMARALGVAPARVRGLTHVQITTQAEFFGVVRGFFHEIRHLVEQDDGYRLLVTAGPSGQVTLRSEEEIQIALKHWLRPMCRALNIDLDRESAIGRGLLDFKLSIGHDFRCLVEVKLFHSAKLYDGLGIQLPTYLMADKSTYGIYVPVFLENSDYDLYMRELHALATQRARSHGIVLDVIDIRAWKPKSASKLDQVDDGARYQLPTLPNPLAWDAQLQQRQLTVGNDAKLAATNGAADKGAADSSAANAKPKRIRRTAKPPTDPLSNQLINPSTNLAGEDS